MDYPHIDTAQSPDDLRHDCEDFIKLRSRHKGSGIAYAYQCQFCGRFRGGEVSKKQVDVQPPFCDPNLEAYYTQRYSQLFREKVAATAPPRTVANDNTVPLDDKLEKFNALISDFCQDNNISESMLFHYHLTRNRESHIRDNYHSGWHSEKQLHQWFLTYFSEWFDIEHEVPGYGFINREQMPLRIDFVIKAKPALIEHGFTDQYIGVEAKYFDPRPVKVFMVKAQKAFFRH
jgi:hypothetical protein